jgi:predicted nucleotidyltransferase
MHKRLAQQAIDILKNLDEVDKLVLYGSVHRGDYRPDSDIDIAFICSDIWKGLPLDLEGIPARLRQKIDNSLKPLQEGAEVKFHIPVYWNSEFKEGIRLPSEKNLSNMLHQVGEVVYKDDCD